MAILQVVDYIVFVAFLLVSLGIGLYFAFSGGKQRTTNEFLMADRQLGIIPATLSILVSFQSAIMILGYPAEMYTRGTIMWVWYSVSIILGIILTERLVLKVFYALKLTSIYEYLEIRFHSRIVRYFGTFLGVAAQIAYMGIAMFAPSIAMEAVSGFPVWCSIIIMAVISTCYTALGGLKAVVWTDVFQFLVMFVGVLIIVIKGTIDVGGFQNIWELSVAGGRVEFVDFDPRPTVRNSVWAYLFGGGLYWLGFYGYNQASIQRLTATRSEGTARGVLLWNIPIIAVLQCVVSFCGLVVYSYFALKKCDPLENKDIRNQNQLLPFFVMNVMSGLPGMPGLFVATLYSGALSSVSSSLSAASANTWEDVLRRRMHHISEGRAAMATRVLVVVYGVVSTLVALVVMAYPGPMVQLGVSFIGAVFGPLIGIFLLGMLTKFVNWKGVLVGGICGIIIIMWIGLGSFSVDQSILNPPKPPVSTEGCSARNTSIITYNHTRYVHDPHVEFNTVFNQSEPSQGMSSNSTSKIEGIQYLYCISYLWYTFVGVLVTVLVSVPVSLCTGNKSEQKMSSAMQINITEALCCCCVKSRSQDLKNSELESNLMTQK